MGNFTLLRSASQRRLSSSGQGSISLLALFFPETDFKISFFKVYKMIVNAYEKQNALCEGHQIGFIAALLFQVFCFPLCHFLFSATPTVQLSLDSHLCGNFCPQVMQSNQNPLKLPMGSTRKRVLHVPFLAKHREAEVVSCLHYS